MSHAATFDPRSEGVPSDEATVDYYLAEIKRLQVQMDGDQRAIERMQVETRTILTDIMADLAVPFSHR